MPKKKSDPFYKQWWFPYAMALFGIPTITFAIAAPQDIKTVKEAVVQNSNTQAALTTMVQEQKERNDKQDAELEKQKEISQLQIESLKGIIAQVSKPR